jgi:hypothetical protein
MVNGSLLATPVAPLLSDQLNGAAPPNTSTFIWPLALPQVAGVAQVFSVKPLGWLTVTQVVAVQPAALVTVTQ